MTADSFGARSELEVGGRRFEVFRLDALESRFGAGDPEPLVKRDGPAGRYLIEHGIQPRDFNSCGSRRGNHEVMMRGTFADIRLRNLLAPKTEGGLTTYLGDHDGDGREFAVRVRIDAPKGADYFRHGGILQYVLRQLLGDAGRHA